MLEGLAEHLRTYAEKDGRGYPDWAVRYAPILKRLRKRDLASSVILEIGANANGFSRFAKVRAVAVDVDIEHLREARATQDVAAVAADAAALPFAGGCVDVCVCVDTFEHLSSRARQDAAGEIVRVLRGTGTAVVTFPSGSAAARAESKINEEYRTWTGQSLSWFEQHAAEELPCAAETVRRFDALIGATHGVTLTKNAALPVWTWMWRVLINGWPGRGNALFQALLRLMTPLLCRLHFGTCYRVMIWLEPK